MNHTPIFNKLMNLQATQKVQVHFSTRFNNFEIETEMSETTEKAIDTQEHRELVPITYQLT